MSPDSLNPAQRPSETSATDVRPGGRPATTPEAAAEQFEEVLVRQFVRTMTEHLFESSLSGEGGGWMKGQADAQRDVLTDVLTEHLVESGALRLSDLLLRQWKPTSDEAGQPAPVAPQKMTSRAPQPLPLSTLTNASDD